MVGRPAACRPAAHPSDWVAAVESTVRQRLGGYVAPVVVRAGDTNAPRWANDTAVRDVHVAFNMFASIARALELTKTATADWVLLLRWDVFFYSAFHLASLDPMRFYLAGSCGKGPWTTLPSTTRTTRCRRGVKLLFDCLPDFWFAAAPALMRQVFLGQRDHRGDAQPPACKQGHAHGVLERRIRHLATAVDLAVGRYKVHMVDYMCAFRAGTMTFAHDVTQVHSRAAPRCDPRILPAGRLRAPTRHGCRRNPREQLSEKLGHAPRVSGPRVRPERRVFPPRLRPH